tara:strand:+ start:365 stop:763 length:399 start_codon:yes stop_codon:yes gene_type:complete
MTTIFSKIAKREIPAYIVAEDDKFMAFLDIFPLKEGHTLVIPKIEIDYLFDLEDNLLTELNLFAKKVAIGIKKTVPCNRIGVTVIGLEVPHAHIHLIPIDHIDDMNFSNNKLTFTKEEFSRISEKISRKINL